MPSRTASSANDEGRMSLGQHLLELRKRLFRSAIGVVVAMIFGFIVSEPILAGLRRPILEIAETRNATLQYDTITGAFDLRLQIALYVGLIVSSPIWLYQIFAYITPALTRREKRFTFGFFFSAVPLFLGGCATGYLVFPHVVELLAAFASTEDASFFNAKYYVDFVVKLVFAVGIAFVLPVFAVLLNFMGVVSGVTLIKSWRIAILIITVFCAAATPAADVVTMFLLAIPMIGLYFAAVAVAFWHDRAVSKRQDAMLAGEVGSAPA